MAFEKIKNKFSNISLKNDLKNENTFVKNTKKVVHNPFSQFVLLGAILIFVNTLAQMKVIPISLSSAIASVIVYAIIALGFCLLLGYSGLASLGTAGFAGIGAYCAFFGFEKLQMGFFVSLILSIVVAALIGVIVGFISLRIEGMYLAILTLGLAEILFEVFSNIELAPSISSSNLTLLGIKLNDSGIFIVLTVVLIVLLIITNNLINSPTGRAMLAMKNSTSAAQAMGISLMKYRLLAFIISTIYASIGGMLNMMVTPYINTSTSTFLALSMSLNILGAVIVGGSRSIWGTSIGVLIIFGLQPIFFINIPFFVENPAFMGLVSGILLVLVVMFFPGGLYQLFYEVKTKIKAIIKKRRDAKYGAY